MENLRKQLVPPLQAHSLYIEQFFDSLPDFQVLRVNLRTLSSRCVCTAAKDFKLKVYVENRWSLMYNRDQSVCPSILWAGKLAESAFSQGASAIYKEKLDFITGEKISDLTSFLLPWIPLPSSRRAAITNTHTCAGKYYKWFMSHSVCQVLPTHTHTHTKRTLKPLPWNWKATSEKKIMELKHPCSMHVCVSTCGCFWVSFHVRAYTCVCACVMCVCVRHCSLKGSDA